MVVIIGAMMMIMVVTVELKIESSRRVALKARVYPSS
jgi:hypothetical protein